MKKLIPYLAFIVASLIMTGCMNIQPIELKKIENVKVESIDNNIATLLMELRINNPNQAKVKIKEIDLIVSYGDTQLGHLIDLEGFDLKSNTEDIYSIPIEVDTKLLKMSLLKCPLNR